MKDVYVMKTPHVLSKKAFERIQQSWNDIIPGTKLQDARLIILDEGMELHALCPPIDRERLEAVADVLDQHDFKDEADFLRHCASKLPRELEYDVFIKCENENDES